MARKRSKTRRARRSVRGLGAMGATTKALLPPTVGVGVALGSALALRAFVKPEPNKMSRTLFLHAPLVGGAVGLGSALLVHQMLGKPAAMVTAVSALAAGGLGWGLERVTAQTGSKNGITLADFMLSEENGNGDGNGNGAEGIRMIRPRYAGTRGTKGLDAVVMRPLGTTPNQQAQGQTVNLQGQIDPSAFGSDV